MESRRIIKFMKKNTFKRIIFILSFGFLLFSFNFVFAAPILTLNGQATIDLTQGDTFVDPGATAADGSNSPLEVKVSGTVDVNTVGSYILTYEATDASGTSSLSRVVNVEAPLIALESISVLTPANKLSYKVGENINIEGLVVEGIYSDGSKKNETISCNDIRGFDSSAPALGQILTIKVVNKTVTYLVDIEDIVLKENFIIKNGDNEIWKGDIPLPDLKNILINNESISSRSVLGMLYKIDEGSDNFAISDLTYDNYFKSFLLNCITVLGSEPSCYNWQYVVNGTYPSIGMDKNILKGGESIYIFFGQTNKILVSSASINDKENITVTAQKYNYENNTWINNFGVDVSIIQVNPNDLYNPIEIQTGITDENGQKIFSSIPIGSYCAGLKINDSGFVYYWPQEKFEVITSTQTDSGSSGSGVVTEKEFSVEGALNFLNKNKKSDGSYGNYMYTDWVAVAAGAGNNSLLKSSLVSYLKSDSFGSSVVTDNERHAMALMALGINPYSGTDVDYIKKIIESFDGNQFGDDSLINDDIFALIVLKNAGYSLLDEIIRKDIAYIISKQSSGGSWGSIDMTAAGIQALKSFDNTTSSVSKAENYLLINQKNDGGFENPFSTSWALQTLQGDVQFAKGKLYLAERQQSDGGMENITDDIDTRVWSTAYAIPAILHKTWDDILRDFSKPIIPVVVNNVDNEKPLKDVVLSSVDILEEKKDEVKVVEKKKENILHVLSNKIKNKESLNNVILENKEIKNIDLMPKENSVENIYSPTKSTFLGVLSHIFKVVISPFTWLFNKFGF